MGELVFSKVQWGKESSAAHGTPVDATRLIFANCNVPKDRNITFIQDKTGRRGGPNRTAVYQHFADGITLEFPNAYFQALPGVFSACLKGDITPTTAAGGAYTWVFDPVLTSTASNMVDSLTLEVGDDTEQYITEYVQFRSVVVAGSAGNDAPATLTANGYGRQVTSGDFTTGITGAIIEPMIGNLAQLWVNDTFAHLGSGVAVANTLIDYNVEVFGGVHPKFMADGQLYFSTHGQSEVGVVAAFTLEGNSTADGYFDLFQAQTPRAIRLKILGSLIGGGAAYHTLQIDAYGKFEEVMPMASDRDGNNLHTAIFRSMDDGTNAIKVTVITDVAVV